MIPGASRDASHDGRPRPDRLHRAGAPGIPFERHQIAHRRGGIHGTNSVPKLLRLFHFLALAIVTVVCAGITSPARGNASLAAPIEVAAQDSAGAVRSALAPQPSHQWRNGNARPAFDLRAVEADIDDDRDTRPDAANHPAAPFTGVWLPRKPGRGLRVEPRVDTSRFACGRGLPRGPPT